MLSVDNIAPSSQSDACIVCSDAVIVLLFVDVCRRRLLLSFYVN